MSYSTWFKIPKAIRFLTIGCTNTIISYCFYSFFCIILGNSAYQAALILSWSISSTISFTTQKYLVFQANGNKYKEYFKCCISWGISYIINAILLELAVKVISLNVFIAQIFANLVAAVTTYILFKKFVFKTTTCENNL